jgi:hypothetical protein
VPKYLEINLIERLSSSERRSLTAAFKADDGVSLFPRVGATARQLRAAVPIIRKVTPKPFLPEPPAVRNWQVWHQKEEEHLTYEALVAPGSPAEHLFGGKNPDSKIRSAIRAVDRVETFKKIAPLWWFRTVKRMLLT